MYRLFRVHGCVRACVRAGLLSAHPKVDCSRCVQGWWEVGAAAVGVVDPAVFFPVGGLRGCAGLRAGDDGAAVLVPRPIRSAVVGLGMYVWASYEGLISLASTSIDGRHSVFFSILQIL